MVSASAYDDYRVKNSQYIKDMLDGTACRPVLFLGSGISRRYIGGPSWIELLHAIAKIIGMPDKTFTFMSQKVENFPIALGSLLADAVHEWAWKEGKKEFPQEYFEPGIDKEIFIKFLVARYLDELAKNTSISPENKKEVELFQKISPHAIITTNFDNFIDSHFSDYEKIIGERIIPMSMNIIGELYKIHGTTEVPESIVLTSKDYEIFGRKRRYISSKMMTYFAEYPVFIVGYGLGDININNILSDLGEALKDKGGLLDNVVYVEWVPDIDSIPNLKEEYAIPVGDGSLPALRLKTIVTSELSWIFQALADLATPITVQTKILRQLAARVVNLVRVDVPQNKIEIDFEHIEKLVHDNEKLAKILGISNIKNGNLNHPYILTQVGHILGFPGWNAAHKLIPQANDIVGFDIKSSDNDYHQAVKTGLRNFTHKYSEAFVNLLKDIRDGKIVKP